MAINGYTDKMRYEPGETIKFMVNSQFDKDYSAEIVQLINGDANPAGPGLKINPIETEVTGQYKGREQKVRDGSYVEISDSKKLQNLQSFSMQTMIWPTTPEKGVQGILTKWNNENKQGYGLFIDEKGCLSLWIGNKNSEVKKFSLEKKLVERCWYLVAVTFDASNGEVNLYQKPMVNSYNSRFSFHNNSQKDQLTQKTTLTYNGNNDAPFIIAGYYDKKELNENVIKGLYNGKIDKPMISDRVLTLEEIMKNINNPSDLLVCWDFSANITKLGVQEIEKIIDVSKNKIHGRTVNLPTRAMTGHNWDGKEFNFIHSPEQYGAIHFHDSDLIDSRWEKDFTFKIPENFKSGVYAALVKTTEGEEDYITFFIRPKKNTATAKIAFLFPTASYLAYANTKFHDGPLTQLMTARAPIIEQHDVYLLKHPEYGHSTYETHSDGSGTCYSSALRPILNMRPKVKTNLSPSLWQFNADLHLVDWLTEKEYEFDVITDQDLHEEGYELLKNYNVLLAGSHAEYSSEEMLDGIEEYQQNGGRLMNFGANSFYWVTQFHPNNSNIIEVRKKHAINTWKADPGELNLSFTGEYSGLWRHRGRAPQKISGVGMIGQGFDVSSYYRRNPDSFDPKVSWIFNGVGEDELIGDFGLVGDGAAGLEMDVYDLSLGSPPETMILASSENHTETYNLAPEEQFSPGPGLSADENPQVRADMIYFPTPNGGAVFATGSIAYLGSLSHNNYNNNISTITENTLNQFMKEGPLKW